MKNRLGMGLLRKRELMRATLAIRVMSIAANLQRIWACKRKNKCGMSRQRREKNDKIMENQII
jgi:hypothetical protein